MSVWTCKSNAFCCCNCVLELALLRGGDGGAGGVELATPEVTGGAVTALVAWGGALACSETDWFGTDTAVGGTGVGSGGLALELPDEA